MRSLAISIAVATSLLGLGAVLAPRATASPFSFSYGGRLADSNDNAISGPVNLELQFFRSASGGSPVPVSPVNFTGVSLSDGVFQVDITQLTPAEMSLVFDSVQDTYVQVVDQTHNITYPRQHLNAIPFALKVPIDNNSIVYNPNGALTLGPLTQPSANQFLTKDGSGNLIWGTPSTGATALQGQAISSSSPVAGQILSYNGHQWVAAAAPALGTVNLSSSTALTGTLPVTSGGTGVTTVPGNGQLLIGNGSNFSLGSLAPGASNGVVITPSVGGIALDTAQAISTSASPTFVSVNLSGSMVVGGGLISRYNGYPGSNAVGAAAQAASSAAAFGDGAMATGLNSVAIGSANSNGTYGISIGTGATNSAAQGGISIGFQATAGNTNSLAIGYDATAANANSIVLGNASNGSDNSDSAAGQFVVRGVQSMFLGATSSNSPTSVSLSAASGSGGSGNVNGASLTLKAGASTGNGTSGSLLFATGSNTATAGTANTQVTRMAIASGGNVGIGTTNPGVTLDLASMTAAGTSTIGLGVSSGRFAVIGSSSGSQTYGGDYVARDLFVGANYGRILLNSANGGGTSAVVVAGDTVAIGGLPSGAIPNATLQVTGSLALNVTIAPNISYSVVPTDNIIFLPGGSGSPSTITLPTCNSPNVGRILVFINSQSGPSSGYSFSPSTIPASNALTAGNPATGASVRLVCNGANYFAF